MFSALCHRCVQWQGGTPVLNQNLFHHTSTVRPLSAHQGIWGSQKGARSRFWELPSHLTWSHLKGSEMLKTEQNSTRARCDCRLCEAFERTQHDVLVSWLPKMETRQGIKWAQLLVEPHSGNNTQNSSFTKKPSLCFSCFFTRTLGCRTRKKRYKESEWGHSGKDSLPMRNPLPFLMLDLHRISSPC